MGPKPPTCQNNHSRAALATTDVAGEELTCLLSEVNENRARLKHGDGLTIIKRCLIDNSGRPVVRNDGKEIGFELLAPADIDRHDLIVKVGLFQKHRDFVTVGRRPVVKINYRHPP